MDNRDRCLPFEIKHRDGVTPISQSRVIQSALAAHQPEYQINSISDIIKNGPKNSKKSDKKPNRKANSPDITEDIDSLEDDFYRIRRSTVNEVAYS